MALCVLRAPEARYAHVKPIELPVHEKEADSRSGDKWKKEHFCDATLLTLVPLRAIICMERNGKVAQKK